MENWQKVKELLNEVLNLDASERENFLNNTEIDNEIREEVKSLLAFEEESEDLINLSAVEFSRGFFDDEKDIENALIGQTIGAYKIISELGFGGMGTVYLAERADGNFSQRVALKLLKREMNNAALRRRFQHEREILESLEHPNIARLLNAGTTDDNIPYIAMEYVEGIQIDDYCNRNDLGLNERLDLFREVCEAVDFAHRNLIVHRDLKPSNILVNENGKAKLLDFGISKILSDEVKKNDSATITKLGVMTPSYASPEQIQGKSVTTATDIYSLGVILYEILSGHRPFETKESDLKDIYQAIIETDPPLPSSMIETGSKEFKKTTKADIKIHSQEDQKSFLEENTEPLTVSNEVKTQVNKTSQTNALSVNLSSSSIRGDLDNIVLKALRKEPERRYSSATNFSEDIRHYLRGLPVTARPNTFSYRASKFIKRNKAVVFATSLIFFAIIGGLFATIWQARVAQTERDRAVLEAKKVEKINAYMQKILNFSNPHWLSSNPDQNRDAKISDALSEALKNIDADLANEPEIQAEILFTIGQTYVSQGQYDKADELLTQAIEKFDEVYGQGNLKSMQTSVILGDTKLYLGKLDEAEKLYNTAISYFRPKVSEDESQIKWLGIALNDLSNIYSLRGNFQEAEKLVQESLKFSGKLSGSDRFMIPVLLSNLGGIKNQTGDFSSALDYYKKAQKEVELKGNQEKFESGNIYLNIGITNVRLEDYEAAEVSFQKAYDILQKTGGEENIYTLFTKYHTANNYYKQGKHKKAEELANETLEKQKKLFPEGHFTIAFSQRLLGDIYTVTERQKLGETELRKALKSLLKTAKGPNAEVANVEIALGRNLIAQKRFDEAKEMLTSALNNVSKTRGEKHPDIKVINELLSEIPN